MKKYIDDFTNNIKKMFTKSEPGNEKDKVTGSTFKEKFSNIGARMKKTGSPLRMGFFATYETVWNVILFFILTVSLLGLLAFSIGLGYFAALVNDEEIQSNEELEVALTEMTESTTVAFGSGESLGTLRADLIRERVDSDDINPYVKDAVIATEDEHFYEHNGVVPKAFMRAALQVFAGGDDSTGGSTLTQQLVKNQLLTNETTFDRKAIELLLAFRVEKLLDKDEILEAYLNAVSFGRNSNGQNIAGIQAAAEGVFGKDAADLNLAESAFLAGMPQNPYAYTPFMQGGTVKDEEYLQPGKNRQEFVLDRMLLEEKITEEEHAEALDYDIYANLTDSVVVPNQNYPFLTDEVERRGVQILKYVLAEEDGLTREEVDATPLINQDYTEQANQALRYQGYHITTTIEKDIYDLMQDVKDSNFYYYGDRSSEDAIDADDSDAEDEVMQHEIGAVLKENDTGRILGFIGGRDHDESSINHATQTSRNVGSTMKPLITFGPALDKGIVAPDTVLLDEKFEIPELNWAPANYDYEEEFGLISTKHALSNSYNLSTLRLWADVREENPREYFERMNLPLQEDMNPSLPLGPNDLSVEQNVDAFSSFAQDGTMTEGYMIESITSPDGEVVYEHEPVVNEVWKDSTAFLMSDMLTESFQTGSAYHISDFYDSISSDYDFAAKTGTSNSFVDSWFMGYNPEVTLGLWMGYDANIPQVSGYEGEEYLHIYNWRNLTQELLALVPDQMGRGASFQQPDSVREMEYCALTMETESDCEENLDQPIEGLVAEDTRLNDKSSLNDPEIQSRMGAAFDSGLSNSSLRGVVTNTYDDRYRVGGSSSSSDDDDDDDDD
ncbi:transglycosylase domain-containing protein [Salinicoccus kekensis]|uniref:Penicillin-binding protein n=1 Tax=Salinicoccus kekensis TaxID=714307 RepID=A0A285UBS5_9STAP|nr:transglycosylase domain-containing protein [Salinicoccus kekensis]SOC39269.1 penicillin-binding protein [Salinicoccus kekensis]